MSIKEVMDAFGDVSHRFFARICFQYFSLDYFFIILEKKTVQVVQGVPEKLCFFSCGKTIIILSESCQTLTVDHTNLS